MADVGIVQLEDDRELLELAVADQQTADVLYRPTNYWSRYEAESVAELRKLGLSDFRRRPDSKLRSFGSNDIRAALDIDLRRSPVFNSPWIRWVPGWEGMLDAMRPLVNRILPITNAAHVRGGEMSALAFEVARLRGIEAGAAPLESLEMSLAGNPDHVFHVGGKPYTFSFLYYYLRYAFVARNHDFSKTPVVVELGSGAGKQVEILRKLHPNVCFIIFDIAPQIYVAEQFLRAIFGDSVVSYRETREMKHAPEPEPGKIFVFPSWQFPIFPKEGVGLFWNSASLQEMEPDVVANYLGFVNERAEAAFLFEAMEGKETARGRGDYGVLEPTTLGHYRDGLPDFELASLETAMTPLGFMDTMGYSDSYWRRRSG